jgi:hypothetical protein
MAPDSDDRLENLLSELGKRRAEGVDVTAEVRRRLDERREPSRPSRRRWFPALAGATATIVIAGSAAAVPALRDAVRDLFDAGGIQVVKRGPQTTGPSSHPPSRFARTIVGAQTTLAAAEASLDGRVVLPDDLGPPTSVYQKGRLVTLVWQRPGLRRPEWVAMEVVGARRVLLRKIVETGSHVRRVDVSGSSGAWVVGPQRLVYLPAHGSGREVEALLNGRTLIWQQGDVAIRLESRNDLEKTLDVAASVR